MGSLHELVVHAETLPEIVEGSLGWRAGRLMELLEGREGMSLRELLDLLAELGTTPADFFGHLYGLGISAGPGEDARFTESQRVLRSALARRRAVQQRNHEPPEGT